SGSWCCSTGFGRRAGGSLGGCHEGRHLGCGAAHRRHPASRRRAGYHRPGRRDWGGVSVSLHVYDDLIQGTDEWMEARRGIVTASVVGQLVTPKTIKPAANDHSRALVAQLVAERITGWSEDPYVSHDMLRGSLDEPVARALYA